MITPIAHVAAMAPYALADLTAPRNTPLISLAQNESAFPPSPRAVEAARDALQSSQLYPDPDWTDLRTAIADVHGLPPEHILCGAGSMELIDCLVRSYAGPDASVLSTQYGYAFFRIAADGAGAEVFSAPEHALTVSIDTLLSAVTTTTRVVCVVNPGNPTGTRIARAEIVRLREELSDDILLIVDEAYGEFTGTADDRVFDLAGRGDTVVLRTFSKAYALAGLRVGWGVFPPAVAGEVRKLLAPNNISCAGQAGAAAAMLDQAHMRKICAETVDLRERFAAQIRRLGLEVPQSHTNFFVIRFGAPERAASAERALRDAGVVLRGLAGYGLPDCLRATVGREADMTAMLEILSRWKEGNA